MCNGLTVAQRRAAGLGSEPLWAFPPSRPCVTISSGQIELPDTDVVELQIAGGLILRVDHVQFNKTSNGWFLEGALCTYLNCSFKATVTYTGTEVEVQLENADRA